MVGQDESVLGLEGMGNDPFLLELALVDLAVLAVVGVVAQDFFRFYLDHNRWIKYY